MSENDVFVPGVRGRIGYYKKTPSLNPNVGASWRAFTATGEPISYVFTPEAAERVIKERFDQEYPGMNVAMRPTMDGHRKCYDVFTYDDTQIGYFTTGTVEGDFLVKAFTMSGRFLGYSADTNGAMGLIREDQGYTSALIYYYYNNEGDIKFYHKKEDDPVSEVKFTVKTAEEAVDEYLAEQKDNKPNPESDVPVDGGLTPYRVTLNLTDLPESMSDIGPSQFVAETQAHSPEDAAVRVAFAFRKLHPLITLSVDKVENLGA